MTRSRAVLIVEDDSPTQLLLGAIAARHGLHPVIAGDGDAALELLAAREFELVLLDLHLPVKHGTEVLRELAVTQPHFLRRIIVITAAHPSMYDDCQEVHAAWTVLRKPFDVDVLDQAMLECRAADGQRHPPHRTQRSAAPHLRRA
jgi:DNA-binding response OmpR family regulator